MHNHEAGISSWPLVSSRIPFESSLSHSLFQSPPVFTVVGPSLPCRVSPKVVPKGSEGNPLTHDAISVRTRQVTRRGNCCPDLRFLIQHINSYLSMHCFTPTTVRQSIYPFNKPPPHARPHPYPRTRTDMHANKHTNYTYHLRTHETIISLYIVLRVWVSGGDEKFGTGRSIVLFWKGI